MEGTGEGRAPRTRWLFYVSRPARERLCRHVQTLAQCRGAAQAQPGVDFALDTALAAGSYTAYAHYPYGVLLQQTGVFYGTGQCLRLTFRC